MMHYKNKNIINKLFYKNKKYYSQDGPSAGLTKKVTL
jgi:hypothetical protein